MAVHRGEWRIGQPEPGGLAEGRDAQLHGLPRGTTNGKDFGERQAILDAIFDGPLPPVFPKVYMSEWSRPGAPARLQKLAETIAALTRNAKRKDSSMMAAIADWEADLEYLFETYYRGRFRFGWPRVSV